MVTIAHLVENIVERRPFLEEALARGIINYAALAEILVPDVERELKKKVKESAVMMALRRFSEKITKNFGKKKIIKLKEADITIKSDLVEITYINSTTIMGKLQKMYGKVDFTKGDFLALTQGIAEATLIINKRYKQKILHVCQGEKMKKLIEPLASLTVHLPLEAYNEIGYIYTLTKALNWENVNIVEIVSTLTEMTFIFREDDVANAFVIIKAIIEESNKTY